MAPPTYLQTILHYISIMDMTHLQRYLRDDYSYQDTTKEIFLAEIGELFQDLSDSGDTEVIVYEGKCAGKMCENCGKKGYRFVGNYSKNYFDLLFEMEGDVIKDIYECLIFRPFDYIDKLGIKGHIEINDDDKISFHKTPEYWTKVYAADNAWSEIITTPPRIIDFGDLCYWIDKNAFADSLIGSFDVFDGTRIMKWTSFSNLYADLREIRTYLTNYIKEIKLANFLTKQIQIEQDLLDWLVKYEETYGKAPFLLKCSILDQDGNYILYPKKNPILIRDPLFNEIMNFIKYFKSHFDGVFLKYSTYTDEDNSVLYNTFGRQVDEVSVFSLKYHLANRKALEDLGIEVPFYLNSHKGDSERE